MAQSVARKGGAADNGGFADLLDGRVIALLLVVCLFELTGWLMNASLYADVAPYFGIAREMNTAVSALAPLGLVLIASKYPHLLERRLMILLTLGCIIVGSIVTPIALQDRIPALILLGFFLFTIAGVWMQAMVCMALVTLISLRAALLAIAVGSALSGILGFLLPLPNSAMAAIIIGALSLVGAVACYQISDVPLEKISHSSSALDLEISNPESFLKPTHALFLCVLLFNIANGYGLTLNEHSYDPTVTNVARVVTVALAFWLVFGHTKKKEDGLFSLAALLVLSGIMIALFAPLSRIGLPNALILFGGFCFSTLYTLVIVAVGRRNLFALLPVLGYLRFFKYLGVNIGAIAGHSATALIGEGDYYSNLIAVGMALVFVAFLWVGFRTFSFTDTIQGVAPIETTLPLDVATAPDARCRVLSEEYKLTEREAEILSLLAHGRNGRYIMESLVVSQNTVKTHIKHIYQKLDIHSQLELFRLIEKRDNQD